MRNANLSDKAKVLSILTPAFQDVQGLRWITGGGPEHLKKLSILLDCAVELTFHQGEIWISDDEDAVMLLYHQKKRTFSWFALFLQIRIALQVVGLRRVPEILLRERYIRRQQGESNCIYVWFIAARHGIHGMESVMDLKNALFAKSFRENLPIRMETTVPKVAATFIRYGFKIYHRWDRHDRKLNVWFLHREPCLNGITNPKIKAQTVVY